MRRFLQRLFSSPKAASVPRPHMFFTPGAERVILQNQRASAKPGETYAACLLRIEGHDLGIGIYALPLPELGQTATEAVSGHIPAYVRHGLEDEAAITVIHWNAPPEPGNWVSGLRFVTIPHPSSSASNPAGLRLSFRRLGRSHPELLADGLSRQQLEDLAMLIRHLLFGDTRAAVVVEVTPSVLVAAYTDELDAVALLEFDAAMAAEHHLTKGTRLLTVNTYTAGTGLAADLRRGQRAVGGAFQNFWPVVAEFLAEDMARLAFLKSQISEDEWARVSELAADVIASGGTGVRVGRPLLSGTPAVRDRA